MQQQAGQGPAAPAALWDQGCYWHLDTRQQEFQSIPRSWSDLRAAADRVDAVLKGQTADGLQTNCHQTLVHGDFKSENLLWNADGRCCAYDFQYVGKGLGVRDIAYMLASSVDIDVLLEEGGEQQLLRHYHSALTQQLREHGKAAAAQRYGYGVMVAQFEVCLVDYVRFMAGWGMWGNAEWASDRAREVLQQLDKAIATARTGW
jgi:thiamine kinase-like enzyme